MSIHSISNHLLTSVLDALPDGVLIVTDQRKMLYTNIRFRELWGIPLEVDLQEEGPAIMRYALEKVIDPMGFVELIEKLHLTDKKVEDEILLKDGRVFRRRTTAFDDPDHGQIRLWIFTDITDAKYSHLDSMTGLWNRNTFELHFESLTDQASPDALVGVALLDIDHFKLFNDTYGHAAGDDVLRSIGEVINELLQRSSDVGFRVGGEEFFVKIVGRNPEDMLAMIEHIRQSIESLGIPHLANPPFNIVTISCGFGITSSSISSDLMYRKIDDALYLSKSQGRNRTNFVELD
jgi:diguanylate cyclase (GGDEF)-like protein